MKPIPFSIELWQQGYRPVNIYKNEVYGLTQAENGLWRYFCDNRTCIVENIQHHVFLLPPEVDEIVVEVKSEWDWAYCNANRPEPGKYKLTKIG
jgi:hypothetical protein